MIHKEKWPSVFLAWLELKSQKRMTLSFILTLTCGIFTLILMDSVGESFAQFFEKRSRVFLGADLVLFSRKPFTEEEQKKIAQSLPKQSERQSYITLYTMALSSQNQSHLVLGGVSNRC